MNAKIISKNLCLIILVFIILYFIYKFLKGYEGFDMPDESLFYKTKNEILQNAAQANN
jgi:hypothetical protein